jgi:AP-1 complex subunit beta-1
VLLDPFIDVFRDEPPLVQLQIVTAAVKLYVFRPSETQDFLQYVLVEATKPGVSPDVRSRA